MIRWSFVCLPCRNSNQLSFVYSAEEKEQLVTFPAQKTTVRSSSGGLPHPPVVNNPTHLRSFIALVFGWLNDFHRSCTPQPHVQFCYPNDTHALFASAPPDSHVRITGRFVQACCSHCMKVSWHFKHAHSEHRSFSRW